MPPGGYAPPPAYPAAPPGGYPGSYPAPGGYTPAPGPYSPQGVLADWGPRALGLLIDWGISLVVFVPLFVLGAAVNSAFSYLGELAVLVVAILLAVQVGQTGQSPGMRTIGLRCINQNTGQPIGAGLGVVRAIAHIVDSLICYIGWLFPLWDRNRQTLADKIMTTVVVRVPSQPFTLTPPGT